MVIIGTEWHAAVIRGTIIETIRGTIIGTISGNHTLRFSLAVRGGPT